MFKLLFFVACVTVAVNAVSQELKEKIIQKMMKIGGECAKETGANEDDIAELLAKKMPSRHEGECMIFCVQKKLEFMNEDGTLNKEGALKTAEPLKADDPELYEKVVGIAKTCAKEVPTEDDKCKYATMLAACSVKKAKEMGIEAPTLR